MSKHSHSKVTDALYSVYPAWLSQLGERWSAERDGRVFKPRPNQHSGS